MKVSEDYLYWLVSSEPATTMVVDMASELLASRRVVDAVRHWLATSALVSDEDCELEAVMTAYEDAMIRATVERARRKREGKWPDYGLQITPLGAIPSPPARPTFAEALEREANLLYEAGVAIHGSERPETNVYRALIKAVERARRASEEL